MIYFDYTACTFWDDAIHTDIPEHVVAISEAQHQELLAALNQGCVITKDLQISDPRPSAWHVWDADGLSWTLSATAAAEQLAQAKTTKLSAINTAAQAYINRASDADLLPAYEVQSWPLQALEAKAWQADPTAATPILDGIAAARGVAADTLKAAALRKTLAYEAVCARVAGRRQALQTAVEKAKTVADIDAVAVDFDEDASA